MAVVQKFEVIFEKLLIHLNLIMKSFPVIIITAVTSTLYHFELQHFIA